MDCIHLSAASLSNDALCHLTSLDHFRTVYLSDSLSIVFEGETFVFEFRDCWIVKWQNKRFHLRNHKPVSFHVSEFDEIRIELFEWKKSWYKTASLSYQTKLVIGADPECDGLLFDDFPLHFVEIRGDQSGIHYQFFSNETCAVNGVLAQSSGKINAPALLQCGLISLFFTEKAVLFNGAAVSFDQDAEIGEIEPVFYQTVCQRYRKKAEIKPLVIEEPEFLKLPSSRGVSLMSMGPMLTMCCASLINAYLSYKNTGNANTLIMPAMMLVSAVVWPLIHLVTDALNISWMKRKRRADYLNECDSRLLLIQKMKKQLKDSLISFEGFKTKDFWQIRALDPMFLQLPVGIGKYATNWKLKTASHVPDVSENACLLRKRQIIAELESIDDVIISCDLKQVQYVCFVCSRKIVNEIMLKLIGSLGSLMDLSDVHYVLYSNDETLNWQLRRTPLFRFEQFSLIMDESVSSFAQEQIFKKLNLSSTVVFVLDSKRALKLPASIRKKIRMITVQQSERPVSKDCSCLYHIRQNREVKEGNLVMPESLDELVRKMELLRFQTSEQAATNQGAWFDSLVSAEKILENWKKTSELCAVVGSNLEGEYVRLNVSEHAEGPHGLIAGMTGSGKSVLLLNLLLSMAANASPEDLQILILDYKGGSLVQQLCSADCVLPHLCGALSNQNSQIGRALSSISYEAKDRQKWFLKASQLTGRSVSNLDEYRQIQLQHAKLKKLADLLIVVDEFAELKKEEPDFLKTLISLSRIGRSLGFHLILCTQKINGVVDEEIIGNSRFQIVLKTARAQESRELAGVDAAAFFKKPGEFLMKCDDRLIQGTAYNCLVPVESCSQSQVHLTDSSSRILKSSSVSAFSSKRRNELLIELLAEAGRCIQFKPSSLWLEPLKVFDAAVWLRKTTLFLGLGDFPEIRQQNPVYLQNDQHLMIGYEQDMQKKGILSFFMKQLLYLENHVYFVQLSSQICPARHCVGTNEDQMQRFIKKMSKVQSKHTVVVVDDLSEFSEYFASAASFSSFLFKAVGRNIQLIAMIRKPFSVSSLILDQFHQKMIFAQLNDADCLQLFHVRRENCRIQTKSQAYMALNERICTVQLGMLNVQLKEKSMLQTIAYLPDVLKRPKDMGCVLGMSISDLKHVQIQEGKWIVSGTSRKKVDAYCQMIGLDAQKLDSYELLEQYTRKSIRSVHVLWIGPQFQYQSVFVCEAKMQVPVSFQEGMVVYDGETTLVRLYDE